MTAMLTGAVVVARKTVLSVALAILFGYCQDKKEDEVQEVVSRSVAQELSRTRISQSGNSCVGGKGGERRQNSRCFSYFY